MPSSSNREAGLAEPPAKRGRAEEAAERSAKPAGKMGPKAPQQQHGGDSEEAANPPADRVVTFNVGGTVVTTLETTLRSTPSQLTEWLDTNFRGLPRDAEGRPFLDCDARNFRYVLNYLRGYGLPAKADDLIMLAEDAVRLDMASLQRDIGVRAPPLWKFNLGPGVSPDGTQFSTADTLSLCGANALSPLLTHTIVFKVEKCDAIAIGVVAFDTVREDQQIFDQRQSVCYRSSGEMIRYFGDEPLFSSGAAFTSGSLVTVRLRYMPEGCTNAALPPLVRTSAPPPAEGATGSPATAPRLPATSEGQQPTLGGFTTADLVDANRQPLPQGQQQRDLAAPPPPSGPPPVARAPRETAQTRSFSAAEDAAMGAPNLPVNRASPGNLSTMSEASPQAAETSAPHFPSPLSLPEVPIGAIVYFAKDDGPQFEARWPAPVPPLQFAVSMQGNSSVAIVEAVSAEDQDGHWDAPRSQANPAAVSVSAVQTPAHLDAPRPPPQGLTALQLPPGIGSAAPFARGAVLPPPSLPPSS